MKKRITIRDIRAMKRAGTPIAMVTAYDYASARLVDLAGLPMILVGDSLGNTMLGYDSTLPVAMEDMIRATAAVTRGARNAVVVADMPFLSYQVSPEDALRNAGRLMREGNPSAVKLEGGEAVAPAVHKIATAGVPVMGHLGLTPQSIHQLGGYRVQGRTDAAASQMLKDALALQDAGAFAVVLELVPAEVASAISQRLEIPTIGIGAGAGCDGQVQVWHDLLGLSVDFTPKHAKKYADAGNQIIEALKHYAEDVTRREFPGEAQTVHLNEGDRGAKGAADAAG